MTAEQLQECKTILKKAESLSVRALVEDREEMWREPLLGREAAPGGPGRNTGSLREIREALARIENGAFGVCANCGMAVELQRLTAMPWTPTCTICEEKAKAAEASGNGPYKEIGGPGAG